MDISKILLLYMSLSLANVIGTSEIPDVPSDVAEGNSVVTETESALPANIESNIFPDQLPIPSPGIDNSPVQSPKPTVAINNSYKMVKLKDRGNNVRKLQKRLIELGYLAEGDDDGVYGNKTFDAVRDFQKANGITRDGVAGSTTLTYLYDYPDVIAKNTPVPTIADVTVPPFEESSIELNGSSDKRPDSLIADARIVISGEQQPLTILTLVDGVMQATYPRLWKEDTGNVTVSLSDLAAANSSWSFTFSQGTASFLTENDTLDLKNSNSEYTCTVNGKEFSITEGEVVFTEDDVRVTPEFMKKTFVKDAIWDEDESSLIIFEK